MKLFRFDPDVGRTFGDYESSRFVISRVVHLLDEATIHCAYLDAKGKIGYHQTAGPQLLLVVQGEGWVRGKSPDKTAIRAGQAAFWEKGEWHESGTETGMTAVIIEGSDVNPAKLMPPV